MNKAKLLCITIAATLSISSVYAAGPRATGASPPTKALSASLSPQQRGAAIGQFVRKWGSYVENAYGVDARTWAQRMVGQFAVGDATNISGRCNALRTKALWPSWMVWATVSAMIRPLPNWRPHQAAQ